MTLAPQERKTRSDTVFRLFYATWGKIFERFRTFKGSATDWLSEHRPEALAVVAAVEAKVDEEALRYIAGDAPDDKAFRAAGSAWYSAWRKAAEALPPPSAGETPTPADDAASP